MAQIKAKQIKLTAQGDLILGDSSANGAVLSIGSASQILKSNGTTAAWGYPNELRDPAGNLVVDVITVGSPVNHLEFSAGATGFGPEIEAVGTDTNIDIRLTTKGTGEVLVPVGYAVVSDNALTTKQYVDGVATGLDFKNSVRAATTSSSELSGFTYNTGSEGGATALVWTGAGTPVFDGITLSDGDRVIIKDSTDPRGNGIFTFDAGSGFRRADDADNTPSNEVSGGMFAFVEEGTTLADTGWVVSSPDGNATLGTDNIIWTQFSAAGVVDPGNGLTQIGTTLNVNVDDVTVYIDGSNNVAVKSSATANQVLLSNGSSTTPSWGALPLNDSNAVTGTLTEANGGTGESTYSEGDLLVGDAGGGLTILPVTDGAGDQVLFYNDSTDTVEWTATSNIGGNSFGTVVPDTGTNVIADSTSDTLTMTGATGISVGGDGSSDTITISPANDLAAIEALGSTGIAVRTGVETWAQRTIVASASNDRLGIDVVNGDGVAGDPTIGLNIEGLTLQTSVDGTNDMLVMWDSSSDTNVRVRPSDIATAGGFVTTAFTTVAGDTGTAIADSTSDTLTIAGGDGITTTAQDSPDAVTIEININELTLETTIDTAADEFVFYDSSAATHRKTTVDDILSNAGVGQVGYDDASATGGANESFVGFFSNTPVNDDAVTVFFNGLALRQTGWTRSGTTLTLVDSVNGYSTESGDIISSRYEY